MPHENISIYPNVQEKCWKNYLNQNLFHNLKSQIICKKLHKITPFLNVSPFHFVACPCWQKVVQMARERRQDKRNEKNSKARREFLKKLCKAKRCSVSKEFIFATLLNASTYHNSNLFVNKLKQYNNTPLDNTEILPKYYTERKMTAEKI